MNPVHPAKETELSLSNARPGCMDCVSLTNSVQNGKECLIYERELFCSMVIGQHNWSIAIQAWHVTSNVFLEPEPAMNSGSSLAYQYCLTPMGPCSKMSLLIS
jgi:hypothetical protein